MAVVVAELLRFPEDLGVGSKGSRALGAEVNVDAAIFEDGCGRGVAILLVDLGRGLEAEQLDVVEGIAGRGVKRENAKGLALLSGCR